LQQQPDPQAAWPRWPPLWLMSPQLPRAEPVSHPRGWSQRKWWRVSRRAGRRWGSMTSA